MIPKGDLLMLFLNDTEFTGKSACEVKVCLGMKQVQNT